MLELRPYQKEAVQALYNWFQQNDHGNPLIVLPTGSGKSLVAAKIFEDALKWPNQRVLNITHVRELISQNYQALIKLWPEAPAGIYSAGLDKRQHQKKIVFAGIQSIYKKAELIGWRDLIIIDEAHLISDSDSGMYRLFIQGMKRINPDMKIIGLSATPWRLKSGLLHKGTNALFNAIAYELPLTRLVKEGYLSPLVNKAAMVQGDTSSISLKGGEFAIREAANAFDRQTLTTAAVDEMLALGADRKSWLVFCILKEHAEHVKDCLLEKGISAACVTDDTPSAERARILQDFKAGRIRALTNVGIATTGFDAPAVDLIAMLRPTMSAGLLVQMLGRGMRIAEGKKDCLVLDFAGNLEMHGPVTHISPPEGVRKKTDRDGKMCQSCRTINPFAATECIDCGAPFARESGPRKIKHSTRASHAEVMSDAPQITDVPIWLDVNHCSYEIHNKPGSPPSLKVAYNCKPHYVLEWVAFARSGYPGEKAKEWWVKHGGQMPVPGTTADAMARLPEIAGMKAQRIKVKKDGAWTRIVGYDLVPAVTRLINTGGNLGGRITQVEHAENTAA